jgi:hypothetical protein
MATRSRCWRWQWQQLPPAAQSQANERAV